jgi:hypothetical protein
VRGRKAFEADELIQSWIVRHLQIIGEAEWDESVFLGHVSGRLASIQGLWGNVRSVRPRDGRAGHEELLELVDIVKGLEDRPLQPTAKVYGLGGAVVKGDVDAVFATVFSSDYSRQEVHAFPLLKRLNVAEGLSNLHDLPVLLEFHLMQASPFPDQAESRPGLDTSDDDLAPHVELTVLPLVFSVKMGRFMVAFYSQSG